MTKLKLAKLPDRNPVKMSIALSPDLHESLKAYLALYREAYGDDAASVADLIPAIVEAFLAGDRAFAKARKAGLDAAEGGERRA